MPDPTKRLELREAVNVLDAMKRDRIVRRLRKIRREAVQSRVDIEYWNAVHPDEPPIATTFEDQVIAWYDGTGPLPWPPGYIPMGDTDDA